MIKKTTFLCGFLLAATSILSAQTQQGYVRTLERPDNVSVALEGVTVQVRGGHNAVVSGQDGLFRLPMDGKRDGDSYTLQQVQKNGFELADQGTLGRRYAYSDKVPLTVVMVSTRQLQADKQRIANNAYQTAERTYKQQLDILEKQLSDRAISEETYRTKLQELQQNLEHYQSLVEDLSDHYARTDYALLDKKEREVNLCIERGELEKADSLLATMFNPLGVLDRNREALAEADRRLAEGQTLMQQAQSDLAAVLRQQEKDAEYLYQLYTIALARFDNEKARQYIETRAALDTSNIEWQNSASVYIDAYVGDYSKTLVYRKRMLRQSRATFGEMSGNTSYCYYSIGYIYAKIKQFDSALYYYGKSLYIGREVIVSERIQAESLLGMAEVYLYKGEYQTAIDTCQKARQLYLSIFGEESSAEADCYNLLGVISGNQNLYEQALDYFMKALTIVRQIYGEKNKRIMGIYDNMGNIYYYEGNYKKSLEYHLKSMLLKEEMLTHNHPDIAFSYAEIGTALEALGNYSKAAEFYQKAIDIYEVTLGDENASTAEVYHKMGDLQRILGNNKKALSLFVKALPVLEKTYGPNHDKVGRLYNSIAIAFSRSGLTEKAIMFYLKSVEIIAKSQGEQNQTVATSYSNLCSEYLNVGEYQKAKEYGFKSLRIRQNILKENHPNIAHSYNNIGSAYYYMNDYDSAIYYMKKALSINEKKIRRGA